MRRDVRRDLVAVFEGTDTGRVLNLPSGASNEVAVKAANSVSLESIIHGLAVIVARELSNEMLQYGVRSADHTYVADVYKVMISRIVAELQQSQTFIELLREHLKMRS